MELPSWLPLHAGITALLYVAEFFICAEELFSTTGNVFETLAFMFVFAGCSLPIWASFLIFFLTGFVWLCVGITFILPLFNNAITGVIAGALILAGVIAVLVSVIF